MYYLRSWDPLLQWRGCSDCFTRIKPIKLIKQSFCKCLLASVVVYIVKNSQPGELQYWWWDELVYKRLVVVGLYLFQLLELFLNCNALEEVVQGAAKWVKLRTKLLWALHSPGKLRSSAYVSWGRNTLRQQLAVSSTSSVFGRIMYSRYLMWLVKKEHLLSFKDISAKRRSWRICSILPRCSYLV